MPSVGVFQLSASYLAARCVAEHERLGWSRPRPVGEAPPQTNMPAYDPALWAAVKSPFYTAAQVGLKSS